MRVTQRTMYDTMTHQMNHNLSAYMESNIQGGTNKRINRPSDDPAGMARVLAYRATIGDTAQYMRNTDTAKGWLSMADNVLTNLSTEVINRIRVLAEEAATSTYTAEQRAGIGAQIRQLLGSIINVSNTRFEGKSIFAGQQYTNSAYQEGLNFTLKSFDGTLPMPAMQITGKLDSTGLVRFPAVSPPNPPTGYLPLSPMPEPEAGTVPPTAKQYTYQRDPAAIPLPADATVTIEVDTTTYEASRDGGRTWTTSTIARGQDSFVVGTATVRIPQPRDWDPTNPMENGNPPNALKPIAYKQVINDEGVRDIPAEVKETNGSLMYLRPTAIYQGANNAPLPKIDSYGAVRGDTINSVVGSDPVFKSFTNEMGTSGQSIMINFPLPVNDPVVDGDTFQYSRDNGVTWLNGTINDNAGDFEFLPDPADPLQDPLATMDGNALRVKGFDPALPVGPNNGTTIYLDRTPVYANTETDPITKVERYGPITMPPIETSTVGMFNSEVLVRFDDNVDMTQPGEFTYSYSTDNGASWNQGKSVVEVDTVNNTSTARLILPGGYMDLKADPLTISPPAPAPGPILPQNGQLLLRPQRTDLSFEIMENQQLTVNNVGTSIFGGLYSSNGRDELSAAFGQANGRNLFETVGRLVGYCETNNQDGIGDALADLTLAHTNVLTELASIGGKTNRLDVSLEVLDSQKFDQTARMSSIEDINLTDLMVTLSKQELAYSTILKSSSMIMQLNLTKFL